jgi:hypothetical protein
MTTLSITTLSLTVLSMMTFSLTTCNKNDTQHNSTQYRVLYAECLIFSLFMMNVVMLNVVMLNVVMLNVIMLNVVMLNVVMLNVIKLTVMASKSCGCCNSHYKRLIIMLFILIRSILCNQMVMQSFSNFVQAMDIYCKTFTTVINCHNSLAFFSVSQPPLPNVCGQGWSLSECRCLLDSTRSLQALYIMF